MQISVIKQYMLAPLAMLAGLVLLGDASHWSSLVPISSFENRTQAAFSFWFVVVAIFAAFMLRSRYSYRKTGRFLLVIALFVLGVYPLKQGEEDAITQSLAVAGMVLFTGGALACRFAHPVFSLYGRLIALQRHLSPPVFMISGYVLFLALALSLSWYCFAFIPGYSDSIAQYVQGKFIRSGHLFGKTPVLRDFFPLPMMVNDGKWYAQYQPLHVFLMGIGHLMSAPWLVNPLEGALTLVCIYLLSRRLFDEATARVAVLLTLGCSFMLFMSAEFMNHATALLFTTLLALSYVEMLTALPTQPKIAYRWAVLAGLSLGAVFLTRPLTAIGVGLPFMLHALTLLLQNARRNFMPCLLMAAAGLCCLLFDLWYNQQTTGSYLLFPTGKYHRSDNASAMGINGAISFQFILHKAQHDWVRINSQLFKWVLPSTFFAMLYFLLPVRNAYVLFLPELLLSHTLVNLSNQFNSGVFGPRYMYETSSAFIILCAAGITRIPLLLKTLPIPLPSPACVRGIIACPIAMLFIFSMLFTLPVTARGYTHFFENHPDFYFSMLRQSEKPALIFIGRSKTPEVKYKWVGFTLPPEDTSEVIFALDRGDEEDALLAQRYPNRHAYIEFSNRLSPFATPKP